MALGCVLAFDLSARLGLVPQEDARRIADDVHPAAPKAVLEEALAG